MKTTNQWVAEVGLGLNGLGILLNGLNCQWAWAIANVFGAMICALSLLIISWNK
jgi:hypothetical protein